MKLPRGPYVSNCLFWAIGRWMRRGGYVAFRRSKVGFLPHFSWSRDLKVFWAYGPNVSMRSWERWFTLALFRGRVKREVR